MPVQIGATTHSFSDPTALLSDCHRRIEMFLRILQKVAENLSHPLVDDSRRALESSLLYFREAAPKHTADEEHSVFPRLRQFHTAEATTALETLDALEQDHRRADSLHAQVDLLGKQCLKDGCLPRAEAQMFHNAVAELASIYRQHIQIEDDLVFPIAARILSPNQKAAIAAEMALRRK